jgi:hypothetical protein
VELGLIICLTVKALLSSKTEALTEELLTRACNMVLAKRDNKMDQTTLDNIIKARRREKESMCGTTAQVITASGSTMNPTV